MIQDDSTEFAIRDLDGPYVYTPTERRVVLDAEKGQIAIIIQNVTVCGIPPDDLPQFLAFVPMVIFGKHPQTGQPIGEPCQVPIPDAETLDQAISMRERAIKDAVPGIRKMLHEKHFGPRIVTATDMPKPPGQGRFEA